MGDFSIGFSNLTFAEFSELVDTYTRLKSGSRTSQQTSDLPTTTPENNFQTPVEKIEVDKFGVPWNPDFHSSTKKQTIEGRWTLRKGADKTAAAAWAQQHTGLSGQGQAPTPPAAASAPVWGMLPPAPRVIDYHKEFIPLVTELSNNGVLTNEKGLEIIQKTGVADSHEFSLNTEKAIAARTVAYDLLLKMKKQAA